MLIESTAAGSGRRTHWDRNLMATWYTPPGVVFEAAAEHDHDTEHPVAECRQQVGEALVERHDHIREFSPSDDTGGSTASDLPEGGSGDATPGVEADKSARVAAPVETAGYQTIQQVAGHLDAVDGSGTATEIRAGLADADPEAVRAAFAAVESSDDDTSDSDNDTR